MKAGWPASHKEWAFGGGAQGSRHGTFLHHVGAVQIENIHRQHTVSAITDSQTAR